MVIYECRRCTHRVKRVLPPIRERTRENDNQRDLEPDTLFEELRKRIEKEAKSLRCPRCDGDMRFTDLLLGKETRQSRVPTPSKPPGSDLRDLLNNLVFIQRRIHGTDVMDAANLASYLRKKEAIRDKIAEYLFWSPGQLIYYDNEDRLLEAKSALQEVWQDISRDEIWDRIDREGWDYTVMVDDYLQRQLAIGPTLISQNPRNRYFHHYFQSAVLCWIHGIFAASIILCCVVLEDLLKMLIEDYRRRSKEDDVVPTDLHGWIQYSQEKGMIDESEQEELERIRLARNKIVHSMKTSGTDKQSLDILKRTIAFVSDHLSK